MDNSNLVGIVAAIVTAGLVACSLWYYNRNKNETKAPKIDSKNKKFSTPEELNKSTTQTSFQEKGGSMAKTLGTLFQEEKEKNSAMIKSSCEEQPSTIHRSESESDKPKNYEEMPEKRLHIPKSDSPIDHTATSKAAENKGHAISSGVSSLDNEDVDSTPLETKTYPLPNEDTSKIQMELQCSRSILLNDQLPISVPLPNETASEVVNEFRCSNVVHAFTGQDLIDLEDYDEEEEIRRLLAVFKRN